MEIIISCNKITSDFLILTSLPNQQSIHIRNEELFWLNSNSIYFPYRKDINYLNLPRYPSYMTPEEVAIDRLQTYLDIPLIQLELSCRLSHCIENSVGFDKTIEDLLSLSEKDLKSIPNLGLHSLLELKGLFHIDGLILDNTLQEKIEKYGRDHPRKENSNYKIYYDVRDYDESYIKYGREEFDELKEYRPFHMASSVYQNHQKTLSFMDHLKVFEWIHCRERISYNGIADEMGVDRQTVRKIVARARKDGLLKEYGKAKRS